MLLQNAAHERICNYWTTLVCDCEPDLLLGPDMLVVAEVLLDMSLDLLAQILYGKALLHYMTHLVPC